MNLKEDLRFVVAKVGSQVSLLKKEGISIRIEYS
jgi:hypothetical protein